MLSRYMDGSRLVYWNDSNGNLTVPGTLTASNIVGASFSLGPNVQFSSIECSSINSGAILNGSNTAYLTYTNTTAPASDGTINGVSLTALNQRVRPSFGEQVSFTSSIWTSRTDAPNYGWRKAAWSPTLKLYCAVSGFPAQIDHIMTSPDGITWTLRILPIALDLTAIIWADELGRFVAIGGDSGGTSYSAVSTDGINWNAYVLPTNGFWLDITWSPQLSRMVAVSYQGGTRSIGYSSDGQTWTTVHPNSPSTTNRWYSVCWSAEVGLFVAVSPFADGGANQCVMTSPDGITWTQRTAPATKDWYSVAWSPELKLFAAVSRTGDTTGVMTSANGVNWTLQTTPAVQFTYITWIPELSMFAAINQNSTSIVMSRNGTTWVAYTVFSSVRAYYGMVWSREQSKLVVLDAGTTGVIITSPPALPASQNTLLFASPGYASVNNSNGLISMSSMNISTATTSLLTAYSINSTDSNIRYGSNAGASNQGAFGVAIGWNSAVSNQGTAAIAVGPQAGRHNQGALAVAYGDNAGFSNQGAGAVAVGRTAGQISQGIAAVAIGCNAGCNAQSNYAVAIGLDAGLQTQGAYAVGVGYAAGSSNQGHAATAVGAQAGRFNQGTAAVAIGDLTGSSNQGAGAVAIGRFAGSNVQGQSAIAIGCNAGFSSQTEFAISIGLDSGRSNQGWSAVAIGQNSGFTSQGTAAVALGARAGNQNQGLAAIAIGFQAGSNVQGIGAVSIGPNAGQFSQGGAAVALGSNAGNSNQGSNAIAIGNGAGETNQIANSIILNASNVPLNAATNAGFYVNPVRNVVTNNVAYYDTTTKEITYGAVLSTFNTFSTGWASIGALNASSLNVNVISSAVANISTVNVNTVIVDYVNVVSTAIVNATTISTAVVGTSTLNVNTISSATGAFNTVNATNVSSAVTGTSTMNVNTISSATGAFNTVNATNVSSAVTGTSTLNVNTISSATGAFNTVNATNVSSAVTGTSTLNVNTISSATGAFNTVNATNVSSAVVGTSTLNVNTISSATGTFNTINATNVSSAVVGTSTMNVNTISSNRITTSSINSQSMSTGTASIGALNVSSIGGFSPINVIDAIISNSTISASTIVGDSGQINGFIMSTITTLGLAVRIGNNPGLTNPDSNVIAIGTYAGEVNQASNAISIGYGAGYNNQKTGAVAMGYQAGNESQSNFAVAVGMYAGESNQGRWGVAVGDEAARIDQGENAVSVGASAGYLTQGSNSVSIGDHAGFSNQGYLAVAVGFEAGKIGQLSNAVAVGPYAGCNTQADFAVAIGHKAGFANQGQNAIAIGSFAGENSQQSNSIVINASGATLDAADSGFYVNPVRNSNGPSILFYDPGASEITYGNLSFTSLDVDTLSTGVALIGTATFTDLPTCSVIPTSGFQLVNKSYADTKVAYTESYTSWTARESNRNWFSVASSSDGTKLTAVVYGGQIYTSTDSGVSWTARETNRNWMSVASSADGTKLVAVVDGEKIYTSTDSGVSWTARESNRIWRGLASSADGTKLVAVVGGGQIYTSIDSGVSWTARESNRDWFSVASSADGTKLVASVVVNGQIYTSTDSGVSWTARETNRIWRGLASSADGTKLVAVVYGGQIYTSIDSGVSWTARDTNRNWNNVTSSADGSKLVAVVDGGQIYTSMDSGLSWTASETIRSWAYVASSSDGNNVVAVVYGGQIFTASIINEIVESSITISSINGLTPRNAINTNILYYDTTTKELTYGTAPSIVSSFNSFSSGTAFIGELNANTISSGLLSISSVLLSNDSVVLGNLAGASPTTGIRDVAIGYSAGRSAQGNTAVAIGQYAGDASQAENGIAIGNSAGSVNQSFSAIAIGTSAGNVNQGVTAISIGYAAGLTTQGSDAIAIGTTAGSNTQGTSAIAIGSNAGNSNQGSNTVAIGRRAGNVSQSFSAVAIGYDAGNSDQGIQAVAVGVASGSISQGSNAVAIGPVAGYSNQGSNAIAIGHAAGETNQIANSIIINASNVALNAATNAGFYVNPVRNVVTSNVMYYDATTKELTYGSAVSSFNSFSTGTAIIGELNVSSISSGVMTASSINTRSFSTGTASIGALNVSSLGGFSPITITDALIANSTIRASTFVAATADINSMKSGSLEISTLIQTNVFVGGYNDSTSESNAWYSFNNEAYFTSGSINTNANCIKYINGRYYMGLDNTTTVSSLLYSLDGLSWTSTTLAISPTGFSNTLQVFDVAYENGLYLTCGESPFSGFIQYSTDGFVWSNAVSPAFPFGQPNGTFGGAFCAAYGNNVWVVGGATREGNISLYYSTDGSNFVNTTTGTFVNAGNINFPGITYGIAFDGSKFVITGADPVSNIGFRWSSNGSNWSSSGFSGATFGSNNYLDCGTKIRYANGIWVAVGYSNAPGGPVKYSYNGFAWSNASGTQNANYTDLVWSGSKWYASLAGGSSSNAYQYSLDGINWSNGTAISNLTRANNGFARTIFAQDVSTATVTAKNYINYGVVGKTGVLSVSATDSQQPGNFSSIYAYNIYGSNTQGNTGGLGFCIEAQQYGSASYTRGITTVPRIYIDPTGKVGIGNTVPYNALDVNGNISAYSRSSLGSAVAYTMGTINSNGQGQTFTGFLIDQNPAGFGGTSNDLYCYRTNIYPNSASGGGILNVYNIALSTSAYGNQGDVYFFNNVGVAGTTKAGTMTIPATTGPVVISTNSAYGTLILQSGNTENGLFIKDYQQGSNNGWLVGNSGSFTPNVSSFCIGRITGGSVQTNVGMFMNSAGNVGIGTSNPTNKLQVDGDIATTSTLKLIGGSSAVKFTTNAGTAYTIARGEVSDNNTGFRVITIADAVSKVFDVGFYTSNVADNSNWQSKFKVDTATGNVDITGTQVIITNASYPKVGVYENTSVGGEMVWDHVNNYLKLQTQANSYPIQLIGSANYNRNNTTTFDTTSDRRIKEDIQDANLDVCISTIKAVKIHKYKYKEEYFPDREDVHVLGVIADEYEQVMPKSVKKTHAFGFSDLKSVNLDQLHMLGLGALQKALHRIDELENTLSSVVSRLNM